MKVEIGLGEHSSVPLITILIEAALVASNSEARRALAQGAVLIDGVQHRDPQESLVAGVYGVHVGPRNARVTIK